MARYNPRCASLATICCHSGGAGVIDSGFHFLDTIRYFYGEPEQVYAEVRAYRAARTADTLAHPDPDA